MHWKYELLDEKLEVKRLVSGHEYKLLAHNFIGVSKHCKLHQF